MLLEQSTLLLHIPREQSLGPYIPSLKVGNVHVRPFLLSICAFRLTPYMTRSCTKLEKAASPRLKRFEAIVTSTRKAFEGIFKMLRFRFPIMKQGFMFAHEDICAYSAATICVILHNMCFAREGDSKVGAIIDTEHYLRPLDGNISDNTHPGKRQREALLFYLSVRLINDVPGTQLQLLLIFPSLVSFLHNRNGKIETIFLIACVLLKNLNLAVRACFLKLVCSFSSSSSIPSPALESGTAKEKLRLLNRSISYISSKNEGFRWSVDSPENPEFDLRGMYVLHVAFLLPNSGSQPTVVRSTPSILLNSSLKYFSQRFPRTALVAVSNGFYGTKKTVHLFWGARNTVFSSIFSFASSSEIILLFFAALFESVEQGTGMTSLSVISALELLEVGRGD